jgi:Ca2+-binding RTX toxin-like protein
VGSEQDVLAGIETARLTGGDTDDRLDASAFPGSVVLTGGAGADVLIGGPLGDRLYGEGGADQLFGNDGHDTLSGGPGADLFNGGTGTDLLLEEELTAGVLTVSALIAPDGIDTLASVEVAVLFASDDGVWLDAGLFPGRVALVGGTGDDTLLGGAGDDVLVGSAGADRLVGRGGNDWLLGNGQWVLDAGVDTLTGGPGDDELDGSNTIARVVEKANANFTLTATRLTGVGTDTLTSIDEVVLTGGAGANVFDVSGWTLPATLDGGGGSDLIRATNDLSMTLTDTALGRGDMPAVALVSVERARLAGGTGNNHLDASAFTRGPVTLLGGEGADTLEGGSWADRLDGGPGLDELWGHGGLDTLLNGEDNHR